MTLSVAFKRNIRPPMCHALDLKDEAQIIRALVNT